MGASACRRGRGRAAPRTDSDRLTMRTDTDAADERVERAALYVHDALQGRCRGIDWAMAAPSRVRAQQVRDPASRMTTATTRQATTTTGPRPPQHGHLHNNRCSAASGSSARRIWSCTCRSDSSSGRSGDVIITPSSRRHHAVITPSSHRHHAIITPSSRRHHAVIKTYRELPTGATTRSATRRVTTYRASACPCCRCGRRLRSRVCASRSSSRRWRSR